MDRDGTNINSGSLDLDFNTTQTNFWFRWSQRWEAGFNSSWNMFKNLYLYDSNNSGFYYMWGYPSISGTGLWTGQQWVNCSNCAFGSAFYTTGISDGSWQDFEMHIDIPNKTLQLWVNGNLATNDTNVDFGSHLNVDHFRIGENCKNVSNGRSMYVDFDDMAINTTGYIGPVSGGGGQDTTAPTTPTNLSATAISSSQINLAWTASTDAVGVTGYNIYRCTGTSCTPSTLLTTSTTNSYSDTGLTANTTYTYAVSAYDASSNTSTQTSSVSATIQDNQSLLFETTFDCPEWITTDGNNTGCDGITKWGDWSTNNGNLEEITASANNPNGGGGRGQRHWVGDGINNNSGSTSIVLPANTSKIWLRWYMRYPVDFEWSSLNHDKVMHLYDENNSQMVPEYQGYNQVRTEAAGGSYVSPDGVGWDNVMSSATLDSNGHRRGDGKWHYWEYYVEPSTGSSKIWIDGALLMNRTGDNFSGNYISTVQIASNQRTTVAGHSDWAVDYDDIAISTTGYIGPVLNTSIIRADVDQNSSINITDALLTLRNSLGLDMSQTVWQNSSTTGDVDCNNITNSTDAMLILRYSLGLDMGGTSWCE